MVNETKRKIKFALIILAIICIVVVIPAFKFYKIVGFGYAVHWSEFGSFISPFVALINTFLLGFLTYKLYSLERGKEQPILDVKINIETIEITNLTNFVAHNVKVHYYHTSGVNNFASIGSILPSLTIILNWTNINVSRIKIEYENNHGKSFSIYPSSTNFNSLLTLDEKEVRFCFLKRKIKPFKFIL